MKIIVLSHGHPRLQKGGGEIAAHAWFELLQSAGHDAVFVGWGGHLELGQSKTIMRELGKHDYVIYTTADYFQFSAENSNLFTALKVLLDSYQPDVVHLHHYIHLGIEAATLIKRLSPRTRVILTLHEYLAICHNNGQLLTTSGVICKGYTVERCHQCFPSISSNSFFMRELSIKAALKAVDHFITPSQFLADQYVSWGLPVERISNIENPFSSPAEVINSSKPAPVGSESWKIGFFGQINFYKGLDVVLQGVGLAVAAGARVELGIHGKISIVTGEQYAESLLDTIRESSQYVKFHGVYEKTEVSFLMSQYHFVIMGSRWYENSPVVIQEALEANRPMIVPGIGGMLEKVKGIGLTFMPDSSTSLQDLLRRLEPDSYADLTASVLQRRHDLCRTRADQTNALLSLYAS